MSMNLHCCTKSGQIELWQTPTCVTYMCLVDSEGAIRNEVRGKEARRALQIYLRWVDNFTNGAWENQEDLDDARERVREHKHWVLEIAKDKTLRVWWM